MSHLFYLVGAPGSGKRTVGKELSALTGAALLDNHLFNDPVFTAFGVDGVSPVPPELFDLAEEVRQVGLRALRLAPPARSHILTNYLSRVEEGEEVVAELRALARERGAAFVPVWLECPLPELEARMEQPERRERLKLRDPLILRGLLERGGVMDAPADALVLNTSRLDPQEAARRIVAFAGAVSGSTRPGAERAGEG